MPTTALIILFVLGCSTTFILGGLIFYRFSFSKEATYKAAMMTMRDELPTSPRVAKIAWENSTIPLNRAKELVHEKCDLLQALGTTEEDFDKNLSAIAEVETISTLETLIILCEKMTKAEIAFGFYTASRQVAQLKDLVEANILTHEN